MPDEALDGSAPPADDPGEVTLLLGAVREGDAASWDRLLALVYADLKRVARHQLRGRNSRETLQATALVHEAYVRLAPASLSFNDRAHFLAVAARAMRRILIDRARARATEKRGSGAAPVTLEGHDTPAPQQQGEELLVLEEALAELEAVDPRLGSVVEMRFFGGMTVEEVAAAMGLSDRTVKSDWRKARAFLEGRLASQGVVAPAI